MTINERDPLVDQAAVRKAAASPPAPHTHEKDDHDHGHHHHGHHHHGHDHHGHDHDDDDGDDDDHHGHDHSHAFTWVVGARIALVGLCAVAVYLGLPDHQYMNIGDAIYLPFSWYGAVGLLIGGWPLFSEAWESLTKRRMTMELSMAIAVIAAAYTGYFLVALWVTFFVLGAEVLEGLTLERGRRAIRDLMDLLPREVVVRRAGAVSEVPSSDLRIGDSVLVAPGGRVPVDGPVLTGHSFIDESRITGESMPVEKMAGARVYAGTINQSGALEIRAEQIGRDTSYGRILEAVERAEKSRAPVQRLADKLAAYIVYVALAFAAFEYWITGGDVNSTIAVIVVAGACGVAAGTPLAILGGIGRSAKLGAIIKGGVHLEVLGKVDTVVLDKTGTLTFGKPEVSALIPEPGVSEQHLLAAAATAEVLSEHPLGKAVMAYAQQKQHVTQEPLSFAYTPGRGIHVATAEGDVLVGNLAWLQDNAIEAQPSDQHSGSEIFVARGGRLLGRIIVEDTIRPEAKQAIDALRKMGIRTVLLTGDAPAIARLVAERLGIDAFEAQLLPEDKLNRVQRLVSSRRVVAMVGDGINDAPALAAASVGVAMGSGTEVAREKADIVLLGNDLAKFAETCRVAQRTRAIIWFNFVGTVLVDVAGIAMAMAGWIGPFEAAAIHTASELTFILNSARLLPNAVFWKRAEVDLPVPSASITAQA